jgi:hypothetical protein
MQCEFCNQTLTTVGNLNYHKKSNKKCLKIQNSDKELESNIFVKCNYGCDILFTKYTLQTHLKTCKNKKLKEEREKDNIIQEMDNMLQDKDDILHDKDKMIEDILKNKDNTIFEQNNKIFEQNNKIGELEKENTFLRDRIIKLEAENNIYIKDHEVIQKLAIQPKTTNTNNNDNRIKINNNFFDNPEKIKQMINEKLTKDYISDGQKGVAQFAYNNLLKDDEGNINYICSDPSRHIFKFQNREGNIEKDIKANKITNMLIDAGITNKTLTVAPSLWTEEDGNIDANKFLTFSPYTNEISTMQFDNTVFRNELACLTSL